MNQLLDKGLGGLNKVKGWINNPTSAFQGNGAFGKQDKVVRQSDVVASCSLKGVGDEFSKVDAVQAGILIFTKCIAEVFFELVHVC